MQQSEELYNETQEETHATKTATNTSIIASADEQIKLSYWKVHKKGFLTVISHEAASRTKTLIYHNRNA